MSGKKIFISYSRNDTEYVSSLVIALRKQGFEVWFDKNIRTGTDWDDTIEEELKKADALVLILSKTSVASDNVKDEISFAMGLDKPVSPIKIEKCDVPMRLARKQFIDFESLGHEVGFERLVKDLNLQFMNEGNVHVPKGTFIPPKQNVLPVYQPRQQKSNNNILYIIGGIVVGGTLVVAFILFLVAIFTSQTNDPITYGDMDDPYNYDVIDSSTTVEDQDWNAAYSKNNLDAYIAYLYTYGKSAKYYSQAYNEINTFLPKTATVWYGVNGGVFNFSKHLYYSGDQTMPPQYDDIITPLFKSELYEGENYVRNGLFVQPGQKLLVYDVWVDVNNNIWAGVRYQL